MPNAQVGRDKLASLGIQIGRWTHSGKFRLGIGALDILAQHAKYKVISCTSEYYSARTCSLTGNALVVRQFTFFSKATFSTPAHSYLLLPA